MESPLLEVVAAAPSEMDTLESDTVDAAVDKESLVVAVVVVFVVLVAVGVVTGLDKRVG